MEICHKYRPNKLGQVVGQPLAVAALNNYLMNENLPHAIMFVGPTGTGKTTLARCLTAHILGHNDDESEIDCAECDPLETVREIKRFSRTKPLGDKANIWVMEEFQSLSRAPFAQQGMLKLLEDKNKPWNYYFLTTTDSDKIIPTIRNRCTVIETQSVPNDDLRSLLIKIVSIEKLKVAKDVVDKIAHACGGSPRAALVLLEQVAQLPLGMQIEGVERADMPTVSESLAKLLLRDNGCTWKEVAAVLRTIKDTEVEKVRRGVLGYARAIMLNVPKTRVLKALRIFRENLYDSGAAGLAEACYLMIQK